MTEPLERPIARAWVIGPSGSGKSTLARRLSSSLGLPYVQLDAYLWGPDWARRTEQEFVEAVDRLASQERWVIDGQYEAVHHVLKDRAEVLVWLDLPRWLTLTRITRRSIGELITRRELYSGNTQSPARALDLLRWAAGAYAHVREANRRLEQRVAPAGGFYWFRTPREVQRFEAAVERRALMEGT